MSLRARVLAGVALIAVVLGAVLVVLTRTTSANLLRQVDAQLAAAVGPVRSFDLGFGPGPRPGGPDGPGAARRLSSLYVGVVDGSGVTTLITPNLGASGMPPPVIEAGEALAAARSGEAFTAGSGEAGVRYRTRAYVDGRARAVVVIALPLEAVDDAVTGVVTVEVLGGLVIVAALALVAWWVIRLGIRPIKGMTSVATDIAGGDLSPRVPAAHPHTEAGELGAALNAMLGRIEAAFEERARAEGNLRQFVADASHKLRTPVATIRGNAELYRSGALLEPGSLDDAMRRTEQEAIRLGRLVDDLLHLARLDQGRPLEVEAVDLAALAEDAARDAAAVDPDRRIEALTGGPVQVTGDEACLRQVLANVVGNALVHTPPGAAVEIRAGREGDRAVLEVTDQGGGMSEADAARAFERFYRADPARARHRGGSGLGLAIVEATVRAHGGTAALRSAPGQGTSVRIELPLDTGR